MTFSEQLEVSTLNTATVQLIGPGNVVVPGEFRFSYNSNATVFSPTVDLSPNTIYQVRAATAIQDLNGNALEMPKVWSFTTSALTNTNPMRIIGNYIDQPVDANKNGKYDSLTVFVDVEVRSAGGYNINARLVDGLGHLIQWTTNENYYDVGVFKVPLVYDGYLIGASGATGPYSLESVNFYQIDEPLVAETDQIAYKTFAYKASQFDRLNIFLPLIRRN